ncbi:hypothetical protein LEAN103870_00920 [Legionella anisa]|uniref:Uncharacterized protein n=1 Tax=Legionella anisa TaxID=28082 RepID=A0AAX0WYV7_9GAMM|nr:hypothetical protein [Legionella anisa]AWN75760.1 hypothetical protein DLD14_08435 [Legionella anisa]KTC67121.1 hypothetical protein Lani_3466 [Legionella anisa]MBN5936305.1 hypothetical protein [Legionella anisa]MCW8426116.1 hypothetical protein [Legionella anisa]MCW8448427.1 hypothetical protein [Legionella anisa]
MPSNQLDQLCQQIEKQKTDHFGKFYMYVSLLNTLTARNKTFADGLPKYATGSMFWRKNHLNIGEIPIGFTQQLDSYAREFINLQPHWSKTLHHIVMAYVRKGKITDLAYIIDQMLSHLMSIQGHQSHNQDIFEYISFEKKKKGLIDFIQQVSTFNRQLLSVADNGCNTALSLLAVTTGFVLVLASIASIIPLIIGLPLVFGGAYGAYHFATKAKAQAEQLETQMKQVIEKISLLQGDLFGDKNSVAFYAAAVKPLPYTVVTAGEQLMFDESQQKTLKGYRDTLDNTFIPFSI